MRHLSATMRAKNTLWICVALAAAMVAAWLVVVLATPTKKAEAAFPGKNGKIVFVKDPTYGENQDAVIVTMMANGDNQTQLTPHDRVADYNPAFSSNGRKIAFERHPRDGNIDIYTMSANGTDKKRVTRSEGSEYDPAWSPDGTRIAFVRSFCTRRDCTDELSVMKAARESETNRPQRVTPSGFEVSILSSLAWSPDGTRIAFAGAPSSGLDLYAIRPDGSDLSQLTTTLNPPEYDPAWSPDGTKIAFVRGPSGNGIYVMKAAKESETNIPKLITGNGIRNSNPDWQPLP